MPCGISLFGPVGKPSVDLGFNPSNPALAELDGLRKFVGGALPAQVITTVTNPFFGTELLEIDQLHIGLACDAPQPDAGRHQSI